MILLCDVDRARRQRDHAESRRQHQRLLTAGHERVDAPFVHLLLEHADRRDAVDYQHRAALARHLADLGHRMHRAGGSLARLHEHRARFGKRLERILDLSRPYGAAPFDAHLVTDHAEGREQLAPSLAELAAVDVNRMLAGLQQIDDRRFHRAGARRCEQDRLRSAVPNSGFIRSRAWSSAALNSGVR